MTGLKEKVIVVTGSSAGIGAVTAVEFAKLGAKLVITGRNQAALDDVAKQCLENGALEVESVVADIVTDEGIETLVNSTLKRFGTVHVLINNAGVFLGEDLRTAKGNADKLDFLYKLLLRSPWKISGYFIDEIIKNKGNIVNVSSAAGTLPNPPVTGYCTMKAGLNHMTKCMATELGMQGVRVNAVAPGMVLTKVLRGFGVPEDQHQAASEEIAATCHILEQKLLMPEDVAQSIVFLASDAASRITGVVLPVDGGGILASPAYDFAGSQGIPGLDKK